MSKIRLTIYELQTEVTEPWMVVKEDRLIESAVEFRQGPKEVLEGPIRIDMLLSDSDEVEGLITYLQKLQGKLPLSEKKTRSSIKPTQPLAQDSIKQLLYQVFDKNKDQESLIENLRQLNFVFVTTDHLKDIAQKNEWPLNFKSKQKVDKDGNKLKGRVILHQDYQWMLRILKVAKTPANDKYDPQVFFGIKLIGDKYPKVLIYELGEYKETKELHWKDAAEVQFKVKEKFYKFPEPMSYEERAKWRAEDRKVLFGDNYEGSAFYHKWKQYVTILKPQVKKKRR